MSGCGCDENPIFKAAKEHRKEEQKKTFRKLEHENYVLDKKERNFEERSKALEEKDCENIWASYNKWDLWQAKQNAEEKRERVESKRKRMEESEKMRAMQMGCHDKSKERAIFEMSNEDKFETCRVFKREGMVYYTEGQFYRSCASFRKITVYLAYTFPDNKEEEKIYNDLMNSSELNMAACKLKTQDYPEVIQHCTSVLRTNKKCVKALLRRSRAYRLSDHFDKALEDLRVAIEVEPSNKILLQEREMLNGQIRGYKNASKKMSAAMFKNKKN